uniref:Protein farnesyltransferase subunit beta n=1 Tax=Sarcophilus harrisii TaxID=9305 RepID=A0A7N4P4V5_SARHA
MAAAAASSFSYFSPPLPPAWSESLYCLSPEHVQERLQDDAVETVTSVEQAKVEDKIQEVFNAYKINHHVPRLILHREKHFHYLKRGLRQLTDAYECLDASRPWLCYWILHSLELLDEPIPESVASESAYCAASVASLTNIITPKLFEGTAEWIARCQNWEGGIGGVPGMEAHGGYTFCGLAALVILKKEKSLNLKCLLQWVTSRQMRFEGGFQGRCNKLVDGCYSFWQAGLLPLLHRALHAQGDPALSMSRWMFHQQALQEYILLCCQCPAGGLLDKPGKSRDFYHTCYCLSGLSIAQHFGSGEILCDVVLGVPENRLQPTHPVYNIAPDKVVQAVMYFLQKPIPCVEEEVAVTSAATD